MMISYFLLAASLFVEPSHPSLSQPCVRVPQQEIASKELQGVIDEMIAIARGERSDDKKAVMVGLAAPQIGINKQIILVDTSPALSLEMSTLKAYINPTITWQSEEQELDREGCYSVDSRICGMLPRSVKITLTAYDRTGALITEELTGLPARIFQHEVDHLNGIRFPDRVVSGGGKLLWIEPDQFQNFRQNWRTWPHEVSPDRWLEMKTGSKP
jgi:peptide deformylase